MEIVHNNHSAIFVAAALLPHGVFEIPAFIIAGALGILLAQSLVNEWYGGPDTAPEAKILARTFIVYVLPLVAVAAKEDRIIAAILTEQNLRRQLYFGWYGFGQVQMLKIAKGDTSNLFIRAKHIAN